MPKYSRRSAVGCSAWLDLIDSRHTLQIVTGDAPIILRSAEPHKVHIVFCTVIGGKSASNVNFDFGASDYVHSADAEGRMCLSHPCASDRDNGAKVCFGYEVILAVDGGIARLRL